MSAQLEANASTEISQRKEDKAWRLAGLVAYAVVCTVVGVGIGLLLVRIFGRDARSVTGVSSLGVVLFGLWKLAIDSWPGVVKFVQKGEVDGARKAVGYLTVTMAGLGSLAATGPKPPNPPATSQPMTFLSIIHAPGGTQEMRDRIVLPFFPARVEGVPCSTRNNVALEALATIDPALQTPLQRTACWLRACSSANKPARLDVQGFASSRDFDCTSARDGVSSDDMNWYLAELRRKSVIKVLQPEDPKSLDCPPAEAGVEGHDFEIMDAGKNRWENFEAMEAARRFQDRANGEPSIVLEVMTRRVDLVIESSGECLNGGG
ncbi:MAG TPA: hypothetical protein VNS57_11630 [Steroidobacteraceae bacterium]|nr:hypothetical protein [Steroidobacteraceae bacterium]